MKPLFSNLRHILPRIKKSDRILLFLDYDGTLTPIVKRPGDAILSKRARATLKALSNNKKAVISVVTGRVLCQIKKLIRLKGIYYAGCHGLEFKKRNKGSMQPVAKKSKKTIRAIKKRLIRGLKGISSYEIEDKGIILALHYRRVKRRDLARLRKVFREATAPYNKRIKIAKGKKVFEVRPPVDWDKGRYCQGLLKAVRRKGERILPIYIGDDVTDEAAFKALKSKGITVFVKGEKKSSLAEYYVDSVREVIKFLDILSG